jgi:hypothetical protein
VDRLIDDVARAMTDANPPADLRAAILARLDQSPSWRLAWLAAPVTVAAVLAMAIALRDRSITLQPAPASPAVAQALSTPVVDPAAAIVAEPARQRSSSRRRAQTMATIPSLAALPGPRALRPFEIQPDALAIPLLSMKPIPTEPIGIRTIDDGSGGR